MIALQPVPEVEQPRSFDPLRADEARDEELDLLPFGVVCLAADGQVLRYNLAEARLARLDRAQVLGRPFFRDIAPCTATPQFEGRVRAFQRGTEAATRFEYVFDFKFGAQEVEVEVVRATEGRVYLLINRRKFLPPREKPFQPAPLQADLAPGEERQGVARDATQRRHVQVTPEFFAALRHTWDRVAPQGWPLFCGEWGTKWGRLAVVDLEAEVLEALGKGLRELPMRQVVGFLAQHLQRQGWGQLEADFAQARHGALVLTLSRGALAEAVGTSTTARCHLMAGFLRAFFGHLATRVLLVREIGCATQGADRCTFALVGLSRKEELEKAMQAGGDAAAVLARLGSHA